jgi:hypothetical protein
MLSLMVDTDGGKPFRRRIAGARRASEEEKTNLRASRPAIA